MASPNSPSRLLRTVWWWALPSMAWVAVVVASTVWNLSQARTRSLDLALNTTRTLFQQIQTAREWNSRHGGVYVPITESAQPNPYLDDPHRDVVTREGIRLTKINPAFMTRQIAQLAATAKGARFHITSLQPIRPANAPDPWEVDALEAFERGTPEVVELLDAVPGSPVFRYMAPLNTQETCLQCHAQHGFALGDVRGGISIEIDAIPILAASRTVQLNLVAVHAAILAVGLGAMLAFALHNRRQWRDLEDSKLRAEAGSRAKGEFLAVISHELRTPLNSVIGYTDLLLDEVDGPLHGEQKKSLGKVERNARQLLHLIDEILDLSKIEAGKLSLHPEPFPLRAGVDETLRVVRPRAQQKGLLLTHTVGGDIPDCLLGDFGRLRQVLLNLLDNGVKFTERGSVALTIRKDSQTISEVCLHFQVEDTGCGIAPHKLEQIFEVFVQGDSSTTRKHGGSGLGLAICSHLIRMMGGRIWVESEQGQGSTFHFNAKFGLPAPTTGRC